jgi:hypothetical protein
MEVPVLSTAHAPSAQALKALRHQMLTAVDPDEGIYFVYFARDKPVDWMRPIHDWVRQKSYAWVRFDPDGDVIDDLPQYDWE